VTGKGVRIHPAALEEAEAAMVWYGKRSSRVAEAFLDEFDGAVARISEHPEQYQLYEFKTRRAMLHRFPYLIVFRESREGIEIIAVAHARRRPGYWRDRV
jgi:plasmid stabilization system protein ParE